MQILSGKCLCDGIEYQITGDIGPIFNCHCSLCRRWHGAAFRTRSTINADQFKWLKGENLLSGYFSSPTTERTFCSVCGSNLISDTQTSQIKSVFHWAAWIRHRTISLKAMYMSVQNPHGLRSPMICRNMIQFQNA